MNAPDLNEARRQFLLSQIRCATLRARLAVAELDSIGIALRGSQITPEDAVEWLADIGAVPCLMEVGGTS